MSFHVSKSTIGIYRPGFIEAIKAPQPWTSIMPTGGVSPTQESLASWFNAGATCVGMGSKLMAKDDRGNFDLSKIKALVRESIQIIQSLR